MISLATAIKNVIGGVSCTHLLDSVDDIGGGHVGGVAAVAVAALGLAQALVDVIDGGLAADEVVEVLLHQRLELPGALVQLSLKVVPPLLQLR